MNEKTKRGRRAVLVSPVKIMLYLSAEDVAYLKQFPSASEAVRNLIKWRIASDAPTGTP